MLLILWAGIAPAIACGGCAWVCGAPGWAVFLLTFAGLLSGLTGGAIVASAYEKLISLRDLRGR